MTDIDKFISGALDRAAQTNLVGAGALRSWSSSSWVVEFEPQAAAGLSR